MWIPHSYGAFVPHKIQFTVLGVRLKAAHFEFPHLVQNHKTISVLGKATGFVIIFRCFQEKHPFLHELIASSFLPYPCFKSSYRRKTDASADLKRIFAI